MSTLTTKLGLSKPADSDTDWGQEYRDAMDIIDDNPGIIVVADSTALAALSDNWEGRLAYNAEDDKLYKYDGTDWIEVGPASVADNTLTTKGDLMVYGTALTRLGVGSNDQVLTADSSQALGMKWANPPESGGGGGSGATTFLFVNTLTGEAIQSALDGIAALGGGAVYLTPGTYAVSATIVIPSNIHLIGLGEVVLQRAAAINAIILNDADGTTGLYDANENICLENIKFDCNSAIYTANCTMVSFGHASNIRIINCQFYGESGAWHMVELNGVYNGLLENCHLYDYTGSVEMIQLDLAFGSAGFPWFGPYDDTPCKNITIRNCYFEASGSEIAIGNHTFVSGYGPSYITIEGCTFRDFATTISLGDVSQFRVAKNKFVECDVGIYFRVRSNDVYDWVLEDNVHFDAFATGAAEHRFFYGYSETLAKIFSRIKILNNIISGCHTHGIGFTATADVIIDGNIITGCGRNAVFLYGCAGAVISNNACKNNNLLAGSGRADIVVGNNSGVATTKALVTGNNLETYITGTNVGDVILTGNNIATSVTNNGGNEAFHFNNLVAGAWVGGAAVNGMPVAGSANQVLAKNSGDNYDASWVDAPAAQNGIPPGGVSGQTIRKISSTDYAVEWTDWPDMGSGTPSGDGTVEDNPETLAESSGGFTASISYIEVLSALWLAGIRFYVGSTAGSVTVNLRTAGGELLATKTITATGTAWNVFTFANPVYLTSHGFYIVEVLWSSQKLWRKTSTLYSGTLWKMRQHRVNDFFTGSVYSETPGLGLVEYDDTP